MGVVLYKVYDDNILDDKSMNLNYLSGITSYTKNYTYIPILWIEYLLSA